MKPGNIGEHVEGTAQDRTSSKAEFEAFHRLGPKTRGVLNYALLPISSNDVLRHALMLGRNPASKRDDASIASDLKAKLKALTGISYTKALCELKRNPVKDRAKSREGRMTPSCLDSKESANASSIILVGR